MKKLNKKEEQMLKQICRRLKMERKKLKLNLMEVKYLSDMSIATISKLERNGSATMTTFVKYANSLGFDVVLQKREEENNNNNNN